jgi:hypothetical protein
LVGGLLVRFQKETQPGTTMLVSPTEIKMTTLTAGTRVTHRGRAWGVGTVLRVGTHVGLDGRHWVLVDFSGWKFHTELKDLEVVA